MFIPKNFKYKKQQKGSSSRRVKVSYTNSSLGYLKLKVLEVGRITSNQLKSFKQAVSKVMKKYGRIQLKVFPHTPITKKPIEVRMGKGKGAFSHWVAKVRPGEILCYIQSEFFTKALKALKYGKFRLPVKTKILL